MGSRMLLLLQIHLAACVSLPAPCNVSISSLNMEHSLSFQPGPETPPGARFAVEALRKNSWRRVAGCSQLTAGQTCNLTQAFKDPYDHYRARVQAFTADRTSNWTVTRQFQPLTDTLLGPPDASVSGCGNCLLLQLSVPTTSGLQQLNDFHRELDLNVRRTRDGAQFSLSLQYEEEIVITYLEPGVEYCVTVAAKTLFNSNSVSSKPHCAFTSPPPAPTSLYVVYSLLGAFSALGFLLFGSVFCSSRLSFKLLRRRLPRRLSYFLFHGRTRANSPPELTGGISATRQQKEVSSYWLLAARRAVQPLRSRSEEREEDGGRAAKSCVPA